MVQLEGVHVISHGRGWATATSGAYPIGCATEYGGARTIGNLKQVIKRQSGQFCGLGIKVDAGLAPRFAGQKRARTLT